MFDDESDVLSTGIAIGSVSDGNDTAVVSVRCREISKTKNNSKCFLKSNRIESKSKVELRLMILALTIDQRPFFMQIHMRSVHLRRSFDDESTFVLLVRVQRHLFFCFFQFFFLFVFRKEIRRLTFS